MKLQYQNYHGKQDVSSFSACSSESGDPSNFHLAMPGTAEIEPRKRNVCQATGKISAKPAQKARGTIAATWHLLTFRLFFYLLGRTVGEYPRCCLLISLMLSLTTIGMRSMVLRDSIQEGYTPLNAQSFYESKVMREFSKSTADPMKLAFMMLAKDGGSMHRKAYLDEAERIVKAIYHVTVKHGGHHLIYANICEPLCYGDEVFKNFKKFFDIQYDMAIKKKCYSSLYNLTYPRATLFTLFDTFTLPIDQCLFGVRLVHENRDNSNNSKRMKRFLPLDWFDTYDIDGAVPIEHQITNMEHVTVIALFLYGTKNTRAVEEKLSLWELGIYEWSKSYNAKKLSHNLYNFLVELLVYGNNILDMEVNADNRKVAPYFGGGFAVMLAIIIFCVFSGAYYNNALDFGKILIGIGAILCPLLAITCTFGILSLLDSRINSLLFVMPFLIMGVGVDSSFIMYYSWQKLAHQGCLSSERLGMVYEECGISITISSSTNVLAFAVGYLTPTPEVQLFCLGSAVSMALTYVFQIFLFGAILSIATRLEKKGKMEQFEKPKRWRVRIDKFSGILFRMHCMIVSKEYIAVFVLLATLYYYYYSTRGILSMKVSLDSVKILPKDSLLRKPNSVLTNYVWKENLVLTVFVNTRFYFMNNETTTQFWDALKELEELPGCKGPNSSYVWFRNFAHKYGKSESDYPYDQVLDPNKLRNFFESDNYHFIHSVKLVRTRKENISTVGELTVRRFFMTIAYTNVSNWNIRIKLMTQWREIVAKYPKLNMTVYEDGGMFVDQMLSLSNTTFKTTLLTLFSMTLVCVIFITRPCSVLTSSLAIASINIGVVGIMSKLSFELDPVVMIALLMTIGMSVDYIAHVAYHFQRETRDQLWKGISVTVPLKSMAAKVENTILTVAWPMVQAAISTICCVFPLTFISVRLAPRMLID
ncbi:unnamed protein product [Cylicocyclus nassatus]|uniref:SSD domain-containing protein n=1 Tax=Cylicocyclus nassatus TaxID=53992 RepID=A0AA36DNF7_CYLNA|nr:unnamed protein product [Cylicocyclus nassatus]